jgi:hypothetical protein
MIGEILALVETILARISVPHGKVHVGPNYPTDELIDDLAEVRRMLLEVEEAGDL